MKRHAGWVAGLTVLAQVLFFTNPGRVLAKPASDNNFNTAVIPDSPNTPDPSSPDTPEGANLSGSPQTAITETTPTPSQNNKNGNKKDDAGSDQTSLSASLMSLSALSGGSSVDLAPNLMASFQVDPYSGSGSIQLPLYAPPGRAGLQPALVLTYSPQNGNGLLGYGWNLEFPYVEASTKYGIPAYDDTTKFIASVGNKLQLVKTSSGNYNSRFYNPDQSVFKLVNNAWQVHDKTSKLYVFGLKDFLQDDSKVCDSTDPNKCYRYLLSKVKDINGNYSFLRHFSDGSFEILYTGEPGTDNDPLTAGTQNFQAKIVGEVEPANRVDPVISYRGGFEVKKDRRLKQISIYAGGELQKKYVFAYRESPRTHRSLLNKITEYGADGVTARPPLTFTYQDADAHPFAMKSGIYIGQSDQQLIAGDFNGDGLTDLGTYAQSSGVVRVALSQGAAESFAPAQVWNQSYVNYFYFFTGDFNGDGKTDIAAFKDPSNDKTVRVAFSDGTKFVDQGVWLSNVISGLGPGVGDFDGDGNADVAMYFEEDGYWKAKIGLNRHKSGFEIWQDRSFIVGADNSYAVRPYVIDFNGDGLSDFIAWDRNDSNWDVRLNTGDLNCGFLHLDTFPGFCPADYPWDRRPVLNDVTGNGLTDIGCWDTHTGQIAYLTSMSNYVITTRILPPVFNIRNVGSGALAADFNGDGLPDYAVVESASHMEIAYSRGQFADLLFLADNGRGGVTTVEYVPSSDYPDNNMPFVLAVVKSVTVSNSLGDSYKTTYAYEGGKWDTKEREFFGFADVKVIDPDGNYVTTAFHQDNAYLKGRPKEEARFDNLGNLFAKKINTWVAAVVDGWTDPITKFTYLKRTDNFVYDGNASGRRTAEEYFYAEILQLYYLTRIIQYGEVDLNTGNDIGSDKRTTEMVYVQNVDSDDVWLHALPNRILVKNNNGEMARRTWFYYDNSIYLNADPDKGLLTKKVEWAGDQPEAVDPQTFYTYDPYGNLVSTKDPRGKSTTITYDSQFNMFPVVTQNALGHRVTNAYYGIAGVPTSGGGYYGLWGQLKSATDPNNQKSSRIYDVFGRGVKSLSPLDSLTYPSTIIEYQENSTYTKITQKQRIEHGQPETIDVVSFSDGLGRLIQKKTKSATAGQYIVSSQTGYNSRGLPEKRYLPRFTSNALDVMDPIDPAKPHTLLQYDTIGRVVSSINPDGTFSSIAYDDWTLTTKDENGHQQKSYFDAWGRLIKKEEYLGADGRSSHYPQSAYVLYAATHYTYDSEGNLIQTKDAHNNITSISYDSLGRKISMADPDMGLWHYGYDLNGNLSWQEDAKGQRIDFMYDSLNRLVHKFDGGNINVEYIYDDPFVLYSVGRLTQVNYGISGALDSTKFTYDVLGREIKSVKTIDGINYTVERKYNALNNLLEVQYPDGQKAHYDYNDVGQIKGMANDKTLFDQQSRLDVWGVLKDKVMVIARWCEENMLGIKEAYADTGLVGHWKLDEPAGAVVAADSSGTSNNGTILGAVPGQAGHTGGAYYFDGTNDYIKVNNASSLNMTSAITINAWINLESTQGNWRLVQKGITDNQYRLLSEWGYLKFDLKNVGSLTTGTIPALNSWHQVAATYDGLMMKMYIDGSLIVSKAITGKQIAVTADPLCIGTKRVGAPEQDYFQGKMDDVRIWNRALSATEILDLYNSGSSQMPAPPVLNSTQAGNASVALSWSAASGATGYKVYYGTSSGQYGTPVDVNNVTQYTVTGLTNGTKYYFALKAYNAGGDSAAYSNEKDATPVMPIPAAPILNSAQTGNASVALSWSAASGATGYKVYYGTSSGQYGTPVDVNNVTQYTVTGLANGTKYYFAVKAYNTGGDSVYSNERDATPVMPIPAAPELNSAQAGNVSVALSWSAASGATGYKVYYGTSSGQYGTPVDVNNVTQCTVTGLTNGTKYYFAVKAYNTGGDSVYSNERDATPVMPVPSAPVLNSAQAGNASVALSWSAASGATGYKVYYGTSSGQYGTPVDVNNVTQYTTTGLTNGTKYYFAIKAYNTGGNSAFSNEKDATPQAPLSPQIIAHWKFDEPAGSTTVVDSVGADNNGMIVGAVSGQMGQIAGALYFDGTNDYVVVDDSPTLNMTTSITIAAWINPENWTGNPRIIQKGISDGQYRLLMEWGKLKFDLTGVGELATSQIPSVNTWHHLTATYDGSMMKIYIDGKAVASAAKSGFLTTTADPLCIGTKKVGAPEQDYFQGKMDDVQIWSQALTDAEVLDLYDSGMPTTLEAPLLNEPISADGQVSLNWSAVGDADGYYVKYGTASGSYPQIIDIGNSTNYTVTGLTNETTYYFVVSAYNVNLESANSTERSASPQGDDGQKIVGNADVFKYTRIETGLRAMPFTMQEAGILQSLTMYHESGFGQMILGVYDADSVVPKLLGTTAPTPSNTSAGWQTIDLISPVKVRKEQKILLAWLYTDSTGIRFSNEFTGGYDNIETWHSLNGQLPLEFVIRNQDDHIYSIYATYVEGQPPAAPVLNEAVAGEGQVTLDWSAVDGAEGYYVKYGTQTGDYTHVLDAGDTTTYTVDGLEDRTTYYFAVTAYNFAGEGEISNELSTIYIAVGYITNVKYNAAGQKTKVEYGNAVVTTYEYNELNLRLKRMRSVNAQNQVLQDLNYSYDSVGNIIEIIDNVNTASQTFAYDAINRLVEASGYQYGTKYYQYDEIGNILSKDGAQYYYGENGAGPHAVTSLDNGSAFNYDANGNMVSRNQDGVLTEYVFDAENRLTRAMKNGGGLAEFEYDGDGGRTRKVAYTAGQERESVFVGSLFEINDIAPVSFIFLGSQRIAARAGGVLAYYHDDHLGGINVITDDAGAQKELVEYEPFGQKSRSEKEGGATSDPIAWHYFTGQRLDDETGLYYYGARYYDPSLGRFITADTIAPDPFDPISLNRYAYAKNNPVNLTDPTGHFWFFAAIAAIFKAATAYAVAHPIIAGAVVGGVLGGANAAISGTNIGQGIGLGVLGGAIGGGIGMGVGSFLEKGMGTFWAGTIGSGLGGASAGAATSAILQGDVGLGALSGMAGAVIAFGGSRVWPLGADAIAGGVSSVIQGGEFGEGAQFGALDNAIMTTMDLLIPMKTVKEQDVQLGDLAYMKADGLVGLGIAFFEGGAFSHVKILTGKDEWVSATPKKGVSTYLRTAYDDRQARIITKFRGNQNVINAAKALAVSKPPLTYNYVIFGGNGRVCSTTCGNAITNGASIPWTGIGPNSQYNMFKSYGE